MDKETKTRIAPRYDEVFAEGTRKLDELAGGEYELKDLDEVTEEDRDDIYQYAIERSKDIVSGRDARKKEEECKCIDATKTLRDLGVTQDEFDTFAHADMEEIDAMQTDIDAQRSKPLICVCGERLDEDSWCAECMHKTRRAVEKYMHRMHEAEAEIERLREENKRLRTALPMHWADTALGQERGEADS